MGIAVICAAIYIGIAGFYVTAEMPKTLGTLIWPAATLGLGALASLSVFVAIYYAIQRQTLTQSGLMESMSR